MNKSTQPKAKPFIGNRKEQEGAGANDARLSLAPGVPQGASDRNGCSNRHKDGQCPD
jgi:hypothetical protein